MSATIVTPDTIAVAPSHTGGANTSNCIDGDTGTFGRLTSNDGNDFKLTPRTDQMVLVGVIIKWGLSNAGIGSGAKIQTGPAGGSFTQLVARTTNFGAITETFYIPPANRVPLASIPTVRILCDLSLAAVHLDIYEIQMILANRGETAPVEGGA
jgi:hypothetical protein